VPSSLCIASVITAAAAKLKVLGSGFGLVDVGRTTMVVSVPRELSGDAAAVLQVAKLHTLQLTSYALCVYTSTLHLRVYDEHATAHVHKCE
jgi:EAP30/Vps36 family